MEGSRSWAIQTRRPVERPEASSWAGVGLTRTCKLRGIFHPSSRWTSDAGVTKANKASTPPHRLAKVWPDDGKWASSGEVIYWFISLDFSAGRSKVSWAPYNGRPRGREGLFRWAKAVARTEWPQSPWLEADRLVAVVFQSLVARHLT